MKKLLGISMVVIMLLAVACTATQPATTPPTTSTTAEPAPTTAAPAEKLFTSTIKIIVPFNPGGSTDMLARLLAPELSTRLGVPVVVENKPGGGGAIGMIEMIKSKPDGQTLILTSINAATLTPNISDVGYTNKEMVPISELTKMSTGIIVSTDSGINSIEDLIAAAEKTPGMTYSTTGTGSIHHLTAEKFMQEIGKPGLLNHVPFDSGTEAIAAVLGQQINFSFGDAADCLAFVKDGKLKVLAIASDPGRDLFLPDVPTFKELGYNIAQMGPWTALAAPAGTPDAVVNKLDETVKEVMDLPAIQEGLVKLSLAPAYLNRAEITEKWMREYEQNGALIKSLGF